MGQGKEVKSAKFINNSVAIAGTAEPLVQVFRMEQEERVDTVYTSNVHKGDIVSVESHPLRDYALVGSKDGSWSFHNIEKSLCLK